MGLALSGVDRLLAYARELDVREVGARQSDRAERTGTPASSPNRHSNESGLRLSLSAEAEHLAASTTETPAPTTGEGPQTRPGEATGSSAHRRAIDAYRRTAAVIPGERFRVIA
ncbi:MAG: hypothetical protein CL908_05665 [Deltaproteobacteria bacterium]|nr:hypothetical protein [Deltaproteobacteria bacterium]